MIHRRLLWLLTIVLGCAPLGSRSDGPLPDGPNVNLVYAKCQQCHPISYVVDSAGLPDFLWQDTLSLMRQLGMQVTDTEEQELYEYLTTYLGTKPPPEPSALVSAEIDGEAVYGGSCAVCHGPEGKGAQDSFPPIAGHAAKLANADRAYLPLAVLYGVTGEIVIDGIRYDAVMPGWSQLSDEEVAAVLNHVTAWGDTEIESYTVDEIRRARDTVLSGAEVTERRPDIP